MRRLVEQKRPGDGGELAQPADALPVLTRQEALEEEVVAGNAARHERRHASRRPGHDHDIDARRARSVHEHLAGIGHARHARVRGERQRVASEHALDELRGARGDHVLVAAHERTGDVQMGQELGGHARVLAADRVGGAEGLRGARRQISQVSDGGAHHIQAPRAAIGTHG